MGERIRHAQEHIGQTLRRARLVEDRTLARTVRELGERLFNLGIRGKQIRHRAICVHLWHERGYVREEDLQANRAIRRQTARHSARFTPHGIVKDAARQDG